MEENMSLRASIRMSKYLASWGANRPFARLTDGAALANNIGETVKADMTYDIH